MSMYKPHIRKLFQSDRWVCSGDKFGVIGLTPEAAYWGWLSIRIEVMQAKELGV